jgi:hypothetical protein
MEDNRQGSERALERSFETNRSEEQLWAMAYQQVWPVIRRRCRRQAELGQQRAQTGAGQPIARRA